MCGICGIITANQNQVDSIVERMMNAQRHRGPDDGDQVHSPFGAGTLGLGHRRLSIIELSPLGRQPMIHPETGDVLVFNGEIYNFRELREELRSAGCVFRGNSDTEVLLHSLVRWDTSCLSRLKGMFAFAFFSRHDNRLILARDPLGIKPLYVAQVQDALLFASEVRALLASGVVADSVDPRAVAGYLAYGAVQAPFTMFRNVVSLKAGSYLQLTPDDCNCNVLAQSRTFWTIPEPNSVTPARDLEIEIAETFDRVVQSHLVSDVSLGIFLSSGLDSTAVTALAVRHSPDVHTFTVTLAEDQALSEAALAGEAARRLGAVHTEVPVAMSDAEELAHEWFNDMDLPSMDGMNVYVISKAVKEQGITVALSGQGGDEMFGGYPSFADVPRARSVMTSLGFVPRSVRMFIADIATRLQSDAVHEKAVDMAGSNGSLIDLCLHRRRTMSNSQMAQLGIEPAGLGLTGTFIAPDEANSAAVFDSDAVASVASLESHFYLGNMLLRDSDVFSMSHSLEVRVPFLDVRMLDLLFSIPGPVRLPNGQPDKHLLRSAMAGVWSGEQLRQKKMGFVLPIAHWMTGALRERCEQGLGVLRESGLVQQEGVDAVWQAFLKAPSSPMWTRAWELCVLGIYLDHLKRRAK